MNTLRKMPGFLGRQMVFAACGFLTLFIFANSYETAFNRNLPYADAISRVNLYPVQAAAATATDPGIINERKGTYGAPTTLKIAARQVKLNLAPVIYDDGNFNARSNTGHYAIVRPSRNGNLGDSIIYLKRSWRTIPEPQSVARDDNIFVDTDSKWRYLYKVVETSNISVDDRYVLPQGNKPQILILNEDTSSGLIWMVRAELVNVQSMQ